MKPYIAVLIDSFNEAVASRVLWILLAAWTLILAGIAPFGYVEEQTFDVVNNDLKDVNLLFKQIEQAREGKGSDAQRRVAERLSNEVVQGIKTFNSKSDDEKRPLRRQTIDQVITGLNNLLADKELYSSEAWPSAAKLSKTKDLLEKGPADLPEGQLRELNRRLVETAFSSAMRPARGEGLWIGYAGFKMGNAIPISRAQANQFVELFAFSLIIKVGLGIIAVFVALVVTAQLIPDMLQAGSLHLLLSKPVSRSLLFLSKFFGGCVFVLLNITYLLTGLYFIAGLRFDIWNEGLIAIIPVIVFVFIIFFSVSALAGVIWKNPIVSVILTMVFWLVCFVIGTVREGFRPWTEQMPQVVSLQEQDGNLISSTQSGYLQVWNQDQGNWQSAVASEFDMGQKVIGPVYLPESRKMVFTKAGRNNMGVRGSRGELTIIDLMEDKAAAEQKPEKEYRWPSEAGPNVPDGTRQVFAWKGTMLALADGGIYRLDTKKLEIAESVPTSLFGFSLPKGTAASPFERVTLIDWASDRPDYMALSPDGNQIWMYHRGSIEKLVWNEKNFVSEQVTELAGEKSVIGLIAAGTTKGVVVRENEVPKVFDLAKPETQIEATAVKPEIPRQIWCLGNSNRFAILFQDGRVGVLDAETLQYSEPNLTGQRNATAISVTGDGALWVAYGARFVTKWDLATNAVVESRANPRSTIQMIYDFVINPIYIVNPKPAALDETIQYLLQGSETIGLSMDITDVEQSRAKIDPWTPLWTNALFVTVILGIACIYLVRHEF